MKGTARRLAIGVLWLLVWQLAAMAVDSAILLAGPAEVLRALGGLESADRRLLEAARVFRVPGPRRFWYLYRPALAGYLTSGCQVALGMCWKSGVAAEVIGVPAGTIGEGFYLSKVNLDTAGLLAWTAALLCLSWLAERLVLRLLRRFFRTL